MPLAGMFCRTLEEAKAAPIFPLTWAHCAQCGLVQVREDIPDAELFEEYNYASSTVPGLVRHFEGYAEVLARHYQAKSSPRFVEMGCNDGVLLRRLPKTWERIGFDPSDVAAKAANHFVVKKTKREERRLLGLLGTAQHLERFSKSDRPANSETFGQQLAHSLALYRTGAGKQYYLFSMPLRLKTAQRSGLKKSVDIVSGSNCLAHISDLRDVFDAVWLLLRKGGDFWVEVHDLEALLRGQQWDTIYHEHKAEWSEASLRSCLEPVGFRHAETTRTPMHGGALRSRFSKVEPAGPAPAAGGPPAAAGAVDPRLEALRRAYQRRYDTAAARRLREHVQAGRKIAAYGAAGRANVYLNQMRDLPFAYIVDESPLRVNKFLPGVGTPVVPRSRLQEEPVDACLITAWNYREDIVARNPDFAGEWLTAFETAG